MARYLIVAHETAMNPDLIEEVKALAAKDPAVQFVLLVPVTPVKHLLRRTTESDAEIVARKRAEEAKAHFAAGHRERRNSQCVCLSSIPIRAMK